jgi:hypothetical protein
VDTEIQVRAAIKKATALVESLDIKDSELRKAALACCFQALLGEKSPPERARSTRTKKAENHTEPPLDVTGFWSTLAAATESKETVLRNIFELQGSRVQLAIPRVKIKGESTVEKRKWHAALVLYGYRAGLGREYVSASDLAAAAKHASLHNDKNYGSHLGKTGWFKGSGSGAHHNYGLSADGQAAAKEYLEELIGT